MTRVLTGLLTGLIALFPRTFRRRFGADMAEQIRNDFERARTRGRTSAFLHSAAQAGDLARAALAERVRPTWTDSPPRTRGVHPMTSKAALWTNLRQDLRFALRSLRRSPGFVVVCVLTLGLAIGVNAGLFSVVDTVLLDPLPYRDSGRLVEIAASAPGTDLPPEFGITAEVFLQYQEQSELLDGLAMFNRFTSTLRSGDRTERVWMSFPSTSLFDVLGATPLMGRLPTAEDEDEVVVLSHSLWKSWFGSDPEILGRRIYASGEDRTVIAVMPEDFWFPNDQVLLWVPNPIREGRFPPWRFGMNVVGRLSPGATPEALATELERLALQVPERFGAPPNVASMIEQHRAVLRPIERTILGGVSGPLWVLLGSVAIVLLIACANVANLFMVRSERRQRDLAVQRAIGAARGRLIQSQMSEALIVAVLAGGLAIGVAWALVPLFVSVAPATVPRLSRAGIDGATLLFAGAASFLSALLFGLAPSVRASAPKLTRLRDGGRGTTRARHLGRNTLVVAQTALALVLLIGSGLLIRSFWQLRQVDPGYEIDDLYSFQIAPEREDLTDAPSYTRFYHEFMERLAALPGVERVGLVENLPLDEGLASASIRTDGAELDVDALTRATFTYAAGDYFQAMGIELLAGRLFDRDDHTTDTGSVLVNETAARQLWPGEDPIGRRLQRQDAEEWKTVVGVVEDTMQYSFRDVPDPLVYLPIFGYRSTPAYVLQTERADVIAPEVRALVQEVAPGAPVYRAYTMKELASGSMVRLSFTMLTLGVASALALILGAIGLYGVLSCAVAERTQEIGVRMALGAAPRRVQRMVVAQGVRVVGLGIVLGVLAAIGATRVLASLLFEVGALDVPTFAWMGVATALLGLLATWLPARRASTVDPIRSLREA